MMISDVWMVHFWLRFGSRGCCQAYNEYPKGLRGRILHAVCEFLEPPLGQWNWKMMEDDERCGLRCLEFWAMNWNMVEPGTQCVWPKAQRGAHLDESGKHYMTVRDQQMVAIHPSS